LTQFATFWGKNIVFIDDCEVNGLFFVCKKQELSDGLPGSNCLCCWTKRWNLLLPLIWFWKSVII